ncbi:protein MICAL-2 [Trichinella spiralis]|uniref:protein MICAL-2 n=1 Tax=Trichinella spiralis TaxID=6334 RepID=UPI0001EFE121|nr:protein MICAL-2 [Trichinella spiralis]
MEIPLPFPFSVREQFRLSMERTETECLRTAMKMFIEASTLESALVAYGQLISLCKANRSDNYEFYKSIRDKFNWWKVKQLWEMLDKRYMNKEYLNQQAGKDLRVLVVGAGPCGLRLAIECAFLGAKLILLKVALLVGVEVYENVAFYKLIEPKMNSNGEISGWKAALIPENHVLADYQFNVLIDASGKQNTVTERSSIGITANFINNNTKMEGLMNECLYDMSYFNGLNFLRKLKANTGIELENFTYHKGDMHHFTMTAKKQNLLNRGIIVQNDDQDLELLDEKNICHEKLLAYVLDGPIWNSGSSIGRGFMSALDAAWMIRSFGCGRPILELLAEKECNYQLLTQVTPCTLQGNVANYTINPCTRYYLTDNLPLPNQMPPLLSSDSHGFLIEEQYSLPSVSYTEDQLNALFNWLQNTFAFHHRRLNDLMSLFNNGTILGMIICHYIRQKAKEIATVRSLWGIEAPDDPKDYEQVCEYLSKIKQKIEEESSSTPTMVLTMGQTKSEEWMEKSVHNGIQPTDVSKNASVEGLKAKEKSQQKTANENDESQRWRLNSERTTVIKADTALRQTLNNNHMKCKSTTSSAKKKLYPAFLQRMIKALGSQLRQRIFKRNNKETTVKEITNVNKENANRVHIYNEREEKMNPALLQVVENGQTLPIVIERRVRRTFDPALLQRMNNQLKPQLRQHVTQQRSVKNIQKMKTASTNSATVNPQTENALQARNAQFQSTDSGSEQICRIISTDCSSTGASVKEISNDIIENGDRVDRGKKSEEKTEPKLIHIVDNNQTLPIILERQERKPLDPALLQGMSNLPGPQLQQPVTQRNSMQNIKDMKTIAVDSAVVNSLTQHGLQLNNDQFQFFDSCSGKLDNDINANFSDMAVSIAEMINDDDGDGRST